MKGENSTFNKIMTQTTICFVVMILGCGVVFAQHEMADPNKNEPECITCAQSFENGFFFKMKNINDQNDSVALRSSSEGMEIEKVWVEPQGQGFYNESPTNYLYFYKSPYYDGTELNSPIVIWIDKVNAEPVTVKYSLYTFKKEFLEKGNTEARFDRLYELTACKYIVPIVKNQADIDKNFDKIYEFGPFDETTSENRRTLYWDGRTDSEITGESLPVRACIFVAAHNAETGELMATGISYRDIEDYFFIFKSPKFSVNKDENGKETLSAKVTLAFDDRPVKITAYIATSHCQVGFPWYDIVNKGTDAMIAVMNANDPAWFSDLQGPLAYKELTDPVFDAENSMIRTYEWKDIKKINWNDQKWKDLLKGHKGGQKGTLWPWYPQPEMDGDYFVPKDNQEYVMGMIVEAFDVDGNPIQTFTGINQGVLLYSHEVLDIPQLTNPQTIVDIPVIIADDKISVSTDGSGNINLICNDGNSIPESYVLINMMGQTVKSGRLSGLHRETISINDMQSGIYIIRINSKNGKTYTQKIIINKR